MNNVMNLLLEFAGTMFLEGEQLVFVKHQAWDQKIHLLGHLVQSLKENARSKYFRVRPFEGSHFNLKHIF